MICFSKERINICHPKRNIFALAFFGGGFVRAGKKEGVRGRNFCLPVAILLFCACARMRRPKGGGRRSRELSGKLFHSAVLIPKIGSSFVQYLRPDETFLFLRRKLIFCFRAFCGRILAVFGQYFILIQKFKPDFFVPQAVVCGRGAPGAKTTFEILLSCFCSPIFSVCFAETRQSKFLNPALSAPLAQWPKATNLKLL